MVKTRAAFTPGPWRLHAGSAFADRVCACPISSSGVDIADCSKGPRAIDDVAERQANARLIAAAPDLAESVADLLKMVEAAHRQLGMWTDKNPRLVKARAALTKATGGA